MGSGALRVRLADPEQRGDAARLLERVVGPVTADADPASLSAACSDPDRAAAALGELGSAGVQVTGFSLDQPSLDEVFLALTDRTTRRAVPTSRGAAVMTSSTHTRPDAGADTGAVRRAISSTARPRPASPLSAALTFGWRGMLKVKHVPEQLLDVTITPVMFVLMFTYLFGGAIAGSTSEYLDYILPGVLVMSVLFTTVYSGVLLNTDRTKGVVDRFRSLPIWRPAPLLGSLLGDAVRYVIAGTVIIGLGVLLGYRPPAGIAGAAAALGLVVVFAFGLSWVFTVLGLVLRSPNAVMNAGFMGIFPLTFLSNVFVDPATLPSALRGFVDINPISILATASRGLMEGTADAGDVLVVLAVAVGLTAVFAPLTTRLYQRS